MPNITRGGNACGLMCYLLGPGRANEHTDQRVLAGTFDIAGRDFFGHRPLTHAEALRVGKRLDLDRLEHGTEVLAKTYALGLRRRGDRQHRQRPRPRLALLFDPAPGRRPSDR